MVSICVTIYVRALRPLHPFWLEICKEKARKMEKDEKLGKRGYKYLSEAMRKDGDCGVCCCG